MSSIREQERWACDAADVSSGYPSGLCASAFELLIRLYWSPTAWMDWVRDVPSNAARVQLSEAGLVDGYEPKIVLSERGLAMVRHILELPLPRQVWLMPTDEPL